METTLLIIVIILAVLVLMMMGLVSYFLFRYLKLKEKQSSINIPLTPNIPVEKVPKELLSEINEASLKQREMVGQFCDNHPEHPAYGICSISGEVCCELCITKENDIKISRKYLNLFLDNEWSTLYLLKNNNFGEEKLAEFFNLKNKLWKESGIPIVSQKQFKINVETDEIELYTLFMARESEKEIIKPKFDHLI